MNINAINNGYHIETIQEQILSDWIASRKRERRVQPIEWEMTEQDKFELARMLGRMDALGLVFAAIVAGLILAILIYHFNWWVVPSLAGAGLIGWATRKLRH